MKSKMLDSNSNIIESGVDTPPAPLVSVAMITYNHEAYISQAIESVLNQKTDFSIELIIGEDCSTDRTRELVNRYAADNPSIIRALGGTTNVGMHENGRRVAAACRGKYVAYLEGDDYWIDTKKLERQVAILEANRRLSATFHRVRWIYDNDSRADKGRVKHGSDWPVTVPIRPNFEDLADEMFIQTGSVVLRKSMLPDLPSWTKLLPWGDWVAFLLLADRGEIEFLPETMSAYRQHPGGATANFTNKSNHENAIQMFRKLNMLVSKPNARTCRRMVVKHLELLADEHEREYSTAKAVNVLLMACWFDILQGRLRTRPFVWIFRLAFPAIHHRLGVWHRHGILGKIK